MSTDLVLKLTKLIDVSGILVSQVYLFYNFETFKLKLIQELNINI